MIETELLSYIGAATGVVGAVTGIAGAAMGFISYRRSNQMKTLDLRLELMTLVVQLFHDMDAVGALIEQAVRSKKAVASATGRRGDVLQRWLKQAEADRESVSTLNEMFDELNVDHSSANAEALESRIVEAHALKSTLANIQQKYASILAEADKEREYIREDVRSRAASSGRPGLQKQ